MKINSGVKKKVLEVVNRGEKGFSLIELIMVIVIGGIISAIAIPRIASISDVDLYATARQVKADIHFSQQLAMGKFMKTTITFTNGTDAYSITNADVAINKTLPSNSRATFDADYSYEFKSTGVPTATNGWSVFVSSGAQSAQVDVSDQTGRATIP